MQVSQGMSPNTPGRDEIIPVIPTTPLKGLSETSALMVPTLKETCNDLGESVAAYFNPSFLPAASRRMASSRRLIFVACCLAESIQAMYVRRYEGARPWK